MKVLLFGTHNAPLLKAMAEGIESLGHSVQYRNGQVYREGDYEACDAAAVFSLHGPGQALLRDYKQHGTPVVVVDYGFICRGTPADGRNQPGKFYFSLARNGLNGLSDPLSSPMPADRWQALGIELKPWKTDGKYILVCGQKTADIAIGNILPRVWALNTIRQIQEITKRPVVFRPHPMDPSQKRQIGVPHDEHHTLVEALRDAYCCVAYNSNSLVESIIAGVPAFALGPGSMVETVASRDLNQLHDPIRPDRAQWAADIAYRQYTINEMKEGVGWDYILGHATKVSDHILTENELLDEDKEILTAASLVDLPIKRPVGRPPKQHVAM